MLDDLLNDGRLARLFANHGHHCALQLWVLQIRSGQSIENRVIYGRLLPYNHSSDRWTATDDDNFRPFGQVQAQVLRLNLYLRSDHSAALLRQLCAGRSVSAISAELGLYLSTSLSARVGTVALAADNLVYRPVAYLLNRDAHERRTLSSPHGCAGALSASITQTDKGAPFRLEQGYNAALTKYVVGCLNEDTGLDFGGADTARFGDLELLVFPALDDRERCLLSVDWVDSPLRLVVRLDPEQLPDFNRFQFCLSILNNDQIVHSRTALAEHRDNKVFEYTFRLSDQIRAIADSTQLEIFGFQNDPSGEGTLCCQWRGVYVREVHVQGNVAGSIARPTKFDWLEKTIRTSAKSRAQEVLTINRSNVGFGSHIGGREVDPWVPANRELGSLFRRLHPPISEGRFFLRWCQGDGEGRLQFVEWFKALLAKYDKHEIVIFDPYFESSGLGLLLLCAAPKANYLVFRSLPKSASEERLLRRKSDRAGQEGINNLMANCEQSSHLLQGLKLRIYGLKEGRLHDRYLLVMGPDHLPVAGFNLSNSLQKAAENYPLLVTPIPADVLLEVEEYKLALVGEALATQSELETDSPSMRLLFDSATLPGARKRYEPLSFLEKTQSGDVLSVWASQPSLRGLSGELLKAEMAVLGLLKDDSLDLPDSASLSSYLGTLRGDFSNFTSSWDIIGEVLAHSQAGDRHHPEIEAERDFLEFLAAFLKSSLKRKHGDGKREFAVFDPRFFLWPIEAFLYSPYRVDNLYHPTKYAPLNWPEYFTIKFLWWYFPERLLEIVEAEVADLPSDPQESDAVRLSLLSQIVSEISLSVQFDIGEAHRERLLRSSNGMLQWMGLSAIEKQLYRPEGLSAVLNRLEGFSYPERVRALGWMINRAARDSGRVGTYKGLVDALHKALPPILTAEELGRIVDSMRGHMRKLAWAEPWLFEDVIHPLLLNGQADVDDACEIWMKELQQMLEPASKERPQLFDIAREGHTTQVAALLMAYSSPARRQISVQTLQATVKRQARIVQQPLASTSNWSRWDRALTVSLWILAFSRCGEYYLQARGAADPALEQLSSAARAVAMVRPMSEWWGNGMGTSSHLAEFLENWD